ncbi:hypothetical protein Tco_1219534 [Tanacetum coccineum]
MHVPEKVVDFKEIAEEHSLEISTVEQLLDEVDNQNIDDNASTECISLLDHMDHICEEVSSLHSKLATCTSSQLPQKISSSIIQESLQSHIPAVSEKFAKTQTKLNKRAVKHQNRQFNISNVAQSKRFVTLQKELSKVIKSKVVKKVQVVGLEGLREDLQSQTKHISKYCLSFQDMQTQLQDVKDLLESAVIINEFDEGEKKKKNENAIPAPTQGEHHTAKNITISEPPVESQEEQPTEVAKSNEGKELTIHNAEETKEDMITMEVDLDEDDKQTLSKRRETGDESKMPNIKSFITPEGLLSQDKIDEHLREFKRLADLKAKKDKSEAELRKLLNPATLKAQAQKWTEHEEKKAKMIEYYNHQISFRADPLPITKISYILNQHKEETIKIVKDNDPLNLIVHPDFRLKTLGSKKKRKRKKLMKKVFVTEDVRVDGMGRNLIPPPIVISIQGLVISEPELEILFMNGNTNIGGEGDGVSNWTSSGVIDERSIEDEEVSLVDGILEGALGALEALEMEALVDAMDVDSG